ncbi:hypothetical protein ACRE1S_04175 [Helicobacter himalayensis]|uniref:hypothetical protein n=1 Tax=Helicobacter himalayensis TaxID=1591088 RepID=UPI003D6FF0D3
MSVLIAGALVGGSLLNSFGQHKTSKEQAKIAKENLDFQKSVYEDEKELAKKYEAEREALLTDKKNDTYNASFPTMRV